MNDRSGSGLYQVYTTSTTTVRPRRGNDDVELDDTAPLPLLIGIGLALFIGFIILVLICCLCRRRRSPTNSPTDRPANSTNYQRAPVNVNDGMGAGVGGVAYPMTTVPPTSYPNSTMPYPPPHMGPTVQHNYGVIGSGMNYNNVPHNQYPQQTPHFGGVPTFPPNQYIPSLPLPPPTAPPHQSHSLSHSSQASTVSGTTADPLVPSSTPSTMSQQQQHLHHGHPHQQQILQYQQLMQPQQPPPSSLQQQQQHQFQQQFMSGRDSPALQFSPMTYTAIMSSDQGVPRMAAASPNTMVTMGTSTSTTASVASPPLNHQGGSLQPVMMPDSATSYTDEEE